MKRTMLFTLSALAAGAAYAQGQVQARNDAATPRAPVPQVAYESAFDGFRPYRDQEMASWRDLNDEVARVGGHIGVLKSGKEMQGARRQEEKSEDTMPHRHGGER